MKREERTCVLGLGLACEVRPGCLGVFAEQDSGCIFFKGIAGSVVTQWRS